MSRCGCGRAILESDVEPAIVALQVAVKSSRPSRYILEHSAEGRQSAKWSSRECSEGSRRNDTHMEDVCRKRDLAEEEPSARRTRIDEAGDAVPGSQDSITRGLQNLQLTDAPAAQPARTVRARRRSPISRRPTQQRHDTHELTFDRAHCFADPEAFVRSTDNGLMMHMGQNHGGQPSMQEKCRATSTQGSL